MMNNSLLHSMLRVGLKPGVLALWLKSVEGQGHLPASGPVLVASNHESYLDFILLDAALPRPPIYLAGEIFYRSRILSWAFNRMRFVRVDRQNRGRGAIRSALHALAGGDLVVIYPEGTRSPDGRLRKAHDGVGMLAHISEAPVVPVAILGAHEAWPKGAPRPCPYPCRVRFGQPLRFSKAAYKKDRHIVSESTRCIMRSIAAIAGEDYPW